MAMKESVILDKLFRIQVGNLLDCTVLKLAVIKALKAEGLKIDLSGWSVDDGEIGDISFIINAALGVLGDPAIEKALYTLGKNCLIGEDENAVKIDTDFFEPPENRKYYYPVMSKILVENLAPFIEGLSLKSLIPSDLMKKFQGLTSKPQS